MMPFAATGQEATDGAFQGSDLLVDGTVAGSRASMLDAADPETLEDDFMYGLTHFRPYPPDITNQNTKALTQPAVNIISTTTVFFYNITTKRGVSSSFRVDYFTLLLIYYYYCVIVCLFPTL